MANGKFRRLRSERSIRIGTASPISPFSVDLEGKDVPDAGLAKLTGIGTSLQ
jgi:hypothetical protein